MRTEGRRSRGRGGFTLVELLVALVLLEVGLLGVVGTLVLATRTLAGAEARQDGVLRARLLLDSLARVEGSGQGDIMEPWGRGSWSRTGSGAVRLRLEVDGAVIDVESHVDVPAEVPGGGAAARDGGWP